MKNKAKLILVLFLSGIFLAACKPFYLTGIDSYNSANSSVGITRYLLPSETFLEDFPSVEQEYNYKASNEFEPEISEQAIMLLKYDPAIYTEAKQFCIDNMDLSEQNRFECHGYRFIHNTRLNDYDTDDDPDFQYPSRFNMICINDEKHILIFLGFCDTESEKVAKKKTNWESFLAEYFGEFYDFDI